MSTIQWLGQHLDNVYRSLIGPVFRKFYHSMVGPTFRQRLPFNVWVNI